jgi:uncharacterized protein (AIM24 family)
MGWSAGLKTETHLISGIRQVTRGGENTHDYTRLGTGWIWVPPTGGG